jgi:uncharacterized protein (TIGR02588 family)
VEHEPGNQKGDEEKEKIPWPERLTALAGFLIFVATIGILAYEGLTRNGDAPAISVHVESIVDQPTGYLARIVARNSGGATGAEVQIVGELMQGNKVVEESTATFSFVPDGAERRGGLFFQNDPRLHTLNVRATGYEDP